MNFVKKLQQGLTVEERSFLPAAVEVLETPASPLKHILTLIICLLFVVALLWSWFSQMDIIVEAQGRIIPDKQIKTISAMQVARVKSLYVEEGSIIRQGDALAEFLANPSDLESVTEQPQQRVVTHKLTVLRLEVLLEHVRQLTDTESSGALPSLESVARQKSSDFPIEPSAQRWTIENNALNSRYESFLSSDQAMLKRIEEVAAIISADQAEISRLEQLLPIHDKLASSSRSLLDKKMLSEVDWLAQREKQISTTQAIAVSKEHLAEHRARLRALIAERKQRNEEFLFQVEHERLTAIQQLDEESAVLKKARERNQNLTLYSPVSGTVQQLQIRSEGDVVQPAQPVMVIIPSEGELEAEIMVENKDIQWLSIGQTVNIKVDTYPYSKYGYLIGTVRSISADSIEKQDTGWVYPVRIALPDLSEKQDLRIQPGMTVTGDVIVGKRRLLEFFLTPLIRHKRESFRETS